jgi:hypothetical protein
LISAKSDSNNEAVSIVVGGENLICTLRSWLSRWSIEDRRADATRCAKQISVPFLAIENSADDGAPASHMHEVYAACGAADKRNETIEGANHYYAGQPELLAIATRITRDFVENRGLLDI